MFQLFSFRNAEPELNNRLAAVYAELEAIEADKVSVLWDAQLLVYHLLHSRGLKCLNWPHYMLKYL